ncbi:MAG: T9SS type A sorting domain-containing protein [Lewinellaceae bacterium]|nr:T9SS type A sorting domain-containing protein [Phaeodactylibacter sp.]MCB9036007.1 T9SS type A sorting domain-containing protein [Lewinellaceae bacterium]
MTVVGDVNISDGIVNLSDNTGTGTLYVAGNFSHTGGTITETVTGRGEIIFNGSAQNYTGGGTISNTIDFTINSGSTLTGTGTIGSSSGTPGTTTNHGTIAPGNSIGTLNVNGPFTTDGTIAMEIAGAPSAANDVLAVNGTVMLGGTLTVTQMGGTITNGDNYDVITGTSISGTFATLNLPGVLTDWMATYTTSLNLAYMGTNPLPIELVYFKGTPMGKAIELTWRTATEQNNDYMAVERSADGAKFTELGRIKGAGTTEEPQEYAFVDEHPLRGLNYYRLRQVDFDGVFAYHKTIGVLFGGKDSGLGVQAWPNPAQGQLQVGWGRNANTPTMLQLLDMTGRKLAEYEVAAGANTFDLPLHGLPAGLYFLKARQGQEEEMVRFWRQ